MIAIECFIIGVISIIIYRNYWLRTNHHIEWLLEACINNDENEFKSLLKTKFTLNKENQDTFDRALYNASKNGNVFMVTKLIELGANITSDILTTGIILQDYDNCIDIAYHCNHMEIVKLLLKNIKKKEKVFILACKYNQIDIIKELIESGFDLNYNNSIGLQIAIEESHVTLVRFFTKRGCTIDEESLESDNEKVKAFLIAKYSH